MYWFKNKVNLVFLTGCSFIIFLLLFKIYQLNIEINNLINKNMSLAEETALSNSLSLKSFEKPCTIDSPDNIKDSVYSYSEAQGFCDGTIDDGRTWWTRTKTPTGEIGIRWSQDGVITTALVFDSKTKILQRVLEPSYLIKQNQDFSKMITNNRYYLISQENQISPDGRFLIFTILPCAGCGDGVSMSESLYAYNILKDSVKSLGDFSINNGGITWINKNTLKIGNKTVEITD